MSDELAPGYRALELLRRGEDLDVYDAWSEARSCRCVVKLVSPEAPDPRSAQRALRTEGSLLLRLAHPHIVRAYELVSEPAALVLETLPGATLEALIDEGARFSPGDLAALAAQLASAVGYLHATGFLHRDLKPGNIVVSGGVTRLLDLSIARRPGRGQRGVGTPGWMSPEQASGAPLGPATDVWGLGLTVYAAATGDLTLLSDEPVPSRLPSIRRHRRLPAPLAALLDACVEPDPARRPTVRALAAGVAECGLAA